MVPERFSLTAGVLFLVVGILAFIPTLSSVSTAGLIPLDVNTSYGLFLSNIPLNVVNKTLLIALGLGGLFAYSRPNTFLPASITFARWVFAIAGALSILGMVAQTNTLFGYAPLYGANVWISGVVSLVAAYFAYALPAKARPRVEALANHR